MLQILKSRHRATGPWQLSRAHRATIASLARVVCPQHSDELDVETIDRDHRLIAEIEASMRALSDVVRAGLKTGLSGYDAGAVLRYGRPAHRLDWRQSHNYFTTWLRIPGPMHEFALRIKQFICMAYYELPEVRAALDYRPEAWIAEVNARRHKEFADAIRAHESAVLAPDPLPPSPGATAPDLIPVSRVRRAGRDPDSHLSSRPTTARTDARREPEA